MKAWVKEILPTNRLMISVLILFRENTYGSRLVPSVGPPDVWVAVAKGGRATDMFM